jgi:hypothetical protein
MVIHFGYSKVKDKCKIVPLHTMKAYGKVEVHFHSLLSFLLDRVEWSAACLNNFILGAGILGIP